MHGKDISIPKGTEITAYVNGDVRMDLAKFQSPAPAGRAAETAADATPAEAASSASAKLSVVSDPSNADIEIDGSFVGDTPSDVEVSGGDHTIVVKKAGFKDWERKLESERRQQYSFERCAGEDTGAVTSSARRAAWDAKGEAMRLPFSLFVLSLAVICLIHPAFPHCSPADRSKANFLPWKRMTGQRVGAARRSCNGDRSGICGRGVGRSTM